MIVSHPQQLQSVHIQRLCRCLEWQAVIKAWLPSVVGRLSPCIGHASSSSCAEATAASAPAATQALRKANPHRCTENYGCSTRRSANGCNMLYNSKEHQKACQSMPSDVSCYCMAYYIHLHVRNVIAFLRCNAKQHFDHDVQATFKILTKDDTA